MIGGIGRFKNISVVELGQEKGHDLETRMKHNFGMGQAGRLPQGAAPDGHGRQVQYAGAGLC